MGWGDTFTNGTAGVSVTIWSHVRITPTSPGILNSPEGFTFAGLLSNPFQSAKTLRGCGVQPAQKFRERRGGDGRGNNRVGYLIILFNILVNCFRVLER